MLESMENAYKSFTGYVTVVMPCYNNGKYVAKAIESVQKQTYTNWELIIVNDGSTDDSEKTINSYAKDDDRIHYISQENQGVSIARNAGAKAANGEFICFLDADDWLAPNALEQAIQAYKKHVDCRMFYLKGIVVVYNEEKVVETVPFRHIDGTYKQVLLNGMDVKIVIRTKDFEEIRGFDENMTNGFEDWEFCIRFLYKRCNIVVSEDILYYYRKNHITNSLSIMAEQKELSVQCYIYKKNMEKFVEELGSPIMQYRWAEHKLPRLCKIIMEYRQKVHLPF